MVNYLAHDANHLWMFHKNKPTFHEKLGVWFSGGCYIYDCRDLYRNTQKPEWLKPFQLWRCIKKVHKQNVEKYITDPNTQWFSGRWWRKEK